MNIIFISRKDEEESQRGKDNIASFVLIFASLREHYKSRNKINNFIL
jgi:hypothetical protein